jgi:hypothetical protein
MVKGLLTVARYTGLLLRRLGPLPTGCIPQADIPSDNESNCRVVTIACSYVEEQTEEEVGIFGSSNSP